MAPFQVAPFDVLGDVGISLSNTVVSAQIPPFVLHRAQFPYEVRLMGDRSRVA